MTIVGKILILIGSLYLFLGGLGIFRMPDVYNRLQAGTKATTLGFMTLTLGVGFTHPSWFLKCIVIIVFIAFTNPVSSSVLAKSAYRRGVNPREVDKNE